MLCYLAIKSDNKKPRMQKSIWIKKHGEHRAVQQTRYRKNVYTMTVATFEATETQWKQLCRPYEF